jgi:two-component system chemotaxis sensor kinase CheA
MTLVLQYEGQRFAIGVSQVLACQTRIMRRLPKEVPAAPLVDGAVLDAHGSPVLVLNVAGLAEAIACFVMERTPTKPPPDPILIIDDSLTTRMLEQSILESAGYRVQLATCAEQGLELAASQQYSLFLVDVEMPGMDGFTFVETTRRDEQLRRVPCILVSSRAAPADLARGKSAGATAYIVKDQFDQRELLRHVRAILGE